MVEHAQFSIQTNLETYKSILNPRGPDQLCDRPKDEISFVNDEDQLTQMLEKFQAMPFEQRLECISHRFLGIKYKNGVLGEGAGATVDPDPLYSFSLVDCMTYVEEVLALANSHSLEEFKDVLGTIRYRAGMATFEMRNHFVEADWIPENTKQGFIGDITNIVGAGVVKQASVEIDRPYFAVTTNKKVGQEAISDTIDAQIALGLSFAEPATLYYIPIESFFMQGDLQQGGLDNNLVQKLPMMSIALMVFKGEDSQKFGTIVSHMGFVIVPTNPNGSQAEPVFRHASSKAKEVTDEPFADYLRSQKGKRIGVAVLNIKELK